MKNAARRSLRDSRIARIAALMVLASGCLAVETHKVVPPPPAGEGPLSGPLAGTVTVLDVAKKSRASDWSYTVTLSYENATPRSFRNVLIRCRAIDPAGFQVAVADVAMHGDFIGPFPPGFKVKETVNLFASEPEAKVSCDIVRAD